MKTNLRMLTISRACAGIVKFSRPINHLRMPGVERVRMNFQEINSKAKKVYTLAFIYEDNNVLLGLKKRGFGEGKWNGFGGKPLEGETVLNAAVREIHEECGLRVKPEDLTQVGIIHFEFVDNPVLMKVHVFKCDKYEGKLTESEEMLPKWYPMDQVPHSQMWADDEIWYPILLKGIKFRGYFLFEGYSTIVKYVLVDFNNPDVVLKSMNF